MKQNLLLDHSFSNIGEASDDIQVFPYTGTGTEGKTLPAINELDGALVLFAFKDGLQFRRVEEDPAGKQFTFDAETNTITFSDETSDIQAGEDISIIYVAAATNFAEPVTLEDAKKWLRIPPDISSEDDILQLCIKAARLKIQNYLSISLVPQIVNLYVQVQSPPYRIPFGPVDNLISITDKNDNVLDLSVFNLKGIKFKQITAPTCGGEYYITFATKGAFDDDYKLLILKQTAWIFEHRGDEQESRLAPSVSEDLKSKRI